MKNNIKKVNVAIDGPSGAGKSTVCLEIAKLINYSYINSGSFYRSIAWFIRQNNIDYQNDEEVKKFLSYISIEFDNQENFFVNKQNVTKELRDDNISLIASKIATYQFVREFVVKTIQETTDNNKGYIMDGRDTTFKILPKAEVKIFLNALPEERAKRRAKQNEELGYKVNYDEVLKDILKRDETDMNRKYDPLHKTDDAIEIDCTNMTFQEVVNKIISIIHIKEQE